MRPAEPDLQVAVLAPGRVLVATLVATFFAQLILRPIHVLRAGLTRLGRGEVGPVETPGPVPDRGVAPFGQAHRLAGADGDHVALTVDQFIHSRYAFNPSPPQNAATASASVTFGLSERIRWSSPGTPPYRK